MVHTRRENAVINKAAEVTGLCCRTICRNLTGLAELRDVIKIFGEKEMIQAKVLNIGFSHSSIIRLINEGKLQAIKVYGKWFVPLDQEIPVRDSSI